VWMPNERPSASLGGHHPDMRRQRPFGHPHHSLRKCNEYGKLERVGDSPFGPGRGVKSGPKNNGMRGSRPPMTRTRMPSEIRGEQVHGVSLGHSGPTYRSARIASSITRLAGATRLHFVELIMVV
jgi:hypothetical protein